MPIDENAVPPYPVRDLLAQPFAERLRLVCKTWAYQVYATPFPVYAGYWLKYLLFYAGGWAFFCSFTPGMGSPLAIGSWAFTAIAFQKAVLWSLCYESLGFGCSSGPMTGRIWPPFGGFLHFLRPGTTKLPFFPGLPVFGGIRRTWLDVALYAATQVCLLRALLAPEISPEMLLPLVILLPLLGITDKTLFLAARGEHYYVALVCLAVASAGDLWLSACKVLWVAIWFWAATSKLNHHFPSVIAVMLTNSPFVPIWLRKRLFRGYPDDLRPSRVAAGMAHMGTLTEYTFPFVLLLSDGGLVTAGALVVMLGFHSFIAGNMPSGMPVEWNIMMVFGGFFLFGHHPEVSVLALGAMPLLVLFLFVCLVAVPLYGNLFPAQVSFLNAMRYYAGNWAYSVWLFRGDSARKLDTLVKAAGLMRDQFEKALPDEEAVDSAMMMMPAMRFLHLEGRVLHEAVPHAVDDIEQYDWMEGEILAGIVLGWNFGDGHLHDLQLLNAIQEQCGFEPGELRVVMVESQPLFGASMAWTVADAASGVLKRGETRIADVRDFQPWPTGRHAEALRSNPNA